MKKSSNFVTLPPTTEVDNPQRLGWGAGPGSLTLYCVFGVGGWLGLSLSYFRALLDTLVTWPIWDYKESVSFSQSGHLSVAIS